MQHGAALATVVMAVCADFSFGHRVVDRAVDRAFSGNHWPWQPDWHLAHASDGSSPVLALGCLTRPERGRFPVIRREQTAVLRSRAPTG